MAQNCLDIWFDSKFLFGRLDKKADVYVRLVSSKIFYPKDWYSIAFLGLLSIFLFMSAKLDIHVKAVRPKRDNQLTAGK